MSVRPAGAAERQFWTFEQLHPGEPVAIVAAAYELPVEVPLEALDTVTRAVLGRHELLRSAFRRRGAGVEVVTGPVEPLRPVLAASARSRDDALALARSLTTRALVDLAEPPLLRVALVRWPAPDDGSGPGGRLLVLLSHHAVLDGGSLGVLAREVGEGLTAALSGRPWEPAPLPASYADLVREERQQEQEGAWEEDLAYWTRQLADAPRPCPAPRGGPDAFACHTRTVRLDAEHAGRIARFAEGARVSPTIVALTAWSQHVLEHTGRPAVVVGVPVSGRDDHRKAGVVGVLMNTLPIVLPRLEGPPADQVRAVRDAFLGGIRHRRPPFTVLAARARPGSSAESEPVYDVMFTQGGEAVLEVGGAPAARVALDEGHSEAPLSLVFVDEADGSARLGVDVHRSEMDEAGAHAWVDALVERIDALVATDGSGGSSAV